MTYYAKQVENGETVALHTMDRPFLENGVFIPVTESEYAALLAEWESAQPEPEPDDISDTEALQIMIGG